MAIAFTSAGAAAASTSGTHPAKIEPVLIPKMRALAKIGSTIESLAMNDLSCPSSTTCIAAGDTYGSGLNEPAVYTLRGTAWSVTVLPEISAPARSTPVLAAISCTSTTSCVATGWFQGTTPEAPFTETLSGSVWTAAPAPLPFSEISCGAAGDCEAVELDSDVIGAFHGGKWTTTSVSAEGNVNAISCPSASDCTAVASGPITAESVASVLRLSGGKWTSTTVESSDNIYLEAVSCPTTSLCEAVGLDRPTLTSADHWIAAAITPNSTTVGAVNASDGSEGTTLSAVSCPTPSWCLASSNGNADFVLSGGSWTQAPSAPGFGPTACRGANSCVNSYFYIQDSSGDWYFDGLPYAQEPQDTTLSGVSCWAAGSCVASGSTANPGTDPLAETRRGSVWSPKTGFKGELDAVSCGAPRDCVAVGGTEIAETGGGGNWVFSTVPTSRSVPSLALDGVSCRAASSCLAIGSSTSGKTVRPAVDLTDNGTWKPAVLALPASDLPARLTAASCASTADCVAIGKAKGGRAIVATMSNGHWSVDVLAAGTALTAVSCPATGACIAVGSEGGRDLVVSQRQGAWGVHLGSVKTTRTPDTLSCPTTSTCWATSNAVLSGPDDLPLIQVTPTNARVVTPIFLEGVYSGEITSISCPTTTSCSMVGSGVGANGVAGLVGIFNPKS